MKIAILGGGISGVTLGRLLAADNHDAVVFEKSGRAGGLCKSRVVDGFTYDEAGGHIIYSKDTDVLNWQIERCGGPEGVHKTVRQTRIRWHDRYVPYPFENGVGHLTKEAIVECMDGYIEAHVQRRLGQTCPKNFKDWIDWRMGSGFAKHFMVPYNEKIWCCDLATMASEWVAGRVPEAPVTDILKSAVGMQTDGYSHQSIFYFPLEGGFETMVRGTIENSGFDLRLNSPVESVAQTKDGFTVNGESFDLVVNTAPLPLIEPAIEGIPAEIRGMIQKLEPISVISILFGMKLNEPMPDYSWIYLPFPEQGPANRVTFFSNYSPRNAPDGHGSFMAEVTHRGDLRPDAQWVKDLGASLGKAGVLDPKDIVTTDWTDNRFAYIDQNLGFAERIEKVRAWFDQSGYITFGRFGRYEYHNSDQCIMRAREVHEHIREIAASGQPARPTFT